MNNTNRFRIYFLIFVVSFPMLCRTQNSNTMDKTNAKLVPVELSPIDGFSDVALSISYITGRKIKDMTITDIYTNERRTIVSISYDELGRPVTFTDNYAESKTYNISYSQDSIIVTMTEFEGEDCSVLDATYFLDSSGRAVKAIYPSEEGYVIFNYYDNNNIKSIRDMRSDKHSENSYVYDNDKRAIAENIDIPQWLVLHFHRRLEKDVFGFLFHLKNNIIEIHFGYTEVPLLTRYSFDKITGFPLKWAEKLHDDDPGYTDIMTVKYALIE